MTALLIIASALVLLAAIYAAWDADRHRTDARRFNDETIAQLTTRLDDVERTQERHHEQQQQLMSKVSAAAAASNRVSRIGAGR
jgi:hypothetical protein